MLRLCSKSDVMTVLGCALWGAAQKPSRWAGERVFYGRTTRRCGILDKPRIVGSVSNEYVNALGTVLHSRRSHARSEKRASPTYSCFQGHQAYIIIQTHECLHCSFRSVPDASSLDVYFWIDANMLLSKYSSPLICATWSLLYFSGKRTSEILWPSQWL